MEIPLRVFLDAAAGGTFANGMPRRLASRTPVRRRPRLLQCSEYRALVLGMFSHYLLFDPE
jgi:hypothetical protein